MSNKSEGTKFEHRLAVELHKRGFWVHEMAQRREGQPSDLICVKDGAAFLIDAKDCKNDVFQIKRIEENQVNAMELFHRAGGFGFFGFQMSDREIFIAPAQSVINRTKDMNRKDIEEIGLNCDDFSDITSYLRKVSEKK